MTEASNWRDVRAQAGAADPTWDSAEWVARRQDDIRAELGDGDSDALNAERVRTEAWVSAFHFAEVRSLSKDI
ncbi:hypothetical protein GCM10027610_113440 [Dactylosporangium cerinum]